jgi:ACS family hexuronate transporter-like MFS transporter
MVSERGMDIKQFALFAWLPFLGADLGCVLSGYLATFFNKFCKLTLTNARIAGIGVGAICMIGPAMVGFASNPIVAILCFSMGGFAAQIMSSLLWGVTSDAFEKNSVATAAGFTGMFAYLGGMSFTLLIGQKAADWGFEPLFACLVGFDIAAFLIIALIIGERRSKDNYDLKLRQTVDSK